MKKKKKKKAQNELFEDDEWRRAIVGVHTDRHMCIRITIYSKGGVSNRKSTSNHVAFESSHGTP
jgi:hypothetical protein